MPIKFTYKNHKGVTRERTVIPKSIDFQITNPEYGYQPGWFLTGIDVEKNEIRSFALSHIILDTNAGNLLKRIRLDGL